MIDRTVDIAREYFLALKLSDKELQEIEDFYIEEERQRQERIKKHEGLSNVEFQEMHGMFMPDDAQQVKDFNSEVVGSEFVVEPDNIVGTATSFNPNEIGSETDYQKELDSQPEPIRRVRNMMQKKYYKDKRLNYSNEYYYASVMSVILNDYMERRTYSVTAYDIACELVEKHKDVLADINAEKYAHTSYPQVVVDEFDSRIDALNRDCGWYTHDDGCRHGILYTAIHYGQEIPDSQIQKKMPFWYSPVVKVITSKYFLYFSLGFCVIPYTIQELFLLILALKNPTQAVDAVGSLREWVNKNGGKYFLLMYTLAGFINWAIIRHFIK